MGIGKAMPMLEAECSAWPSQYAEMGPPPVRNK